MTTISTLIIHLREAAKLSSVQTKGAVEFRVLAAALERFSMVGLDEFTEALEKLLLPKQKPTPAQIAEKIRAAFGDDEQFDQYLDTLRAPKAYSADQLKEVYNLTLRRSRSFAKSASKKSVLDELVAERKIMLTNDNAFEVIRRLSGR